MSPGPISLMGGGEHMPSLVAADRELMELSGAGAPRVTVLPQAPARGQMAKTVALARNHWSRLGARVEVARPEIDLIHAFDAISTADIAVMPGGHPNKLVDGLAASPAFDLVVDRWIGGMAIAGSSAGAMAMFEWRLRLYPPNPLELIPGLGLLDGYVAAPHFDRFRAERWAWRVTPRMRGNGILGLDEATALVGFNRNFRVLGGGVVTVVRDRQVTSYRVGGEIDLDLCAGSSLRFATASDTLPEIGTADLEIGQGLRSLTLSR